MSKKTIKRNVLEEGDRYAASRERFVQSIPWIVSGMLFLIILIRILIIARLDMQTALAVIQQIGPIELAPGMLISLLPTLGATVSIIGARIVHINDVNNLSRREIVTNWSFYCIIVIVFSFIQIWVVTLLQIIMPVVMIMVYKIIDRNSARPKKASKFNVLHWAKKNNGRGRSEDSRETKYPDPEDSILHGYVIELEEVDGKIKNATVGPVNLDELGALRKERERIVNNYIERMDAISRPWKSSVDTAIMGLIAYFILSNLTVFLRDAPWMPSEKVEISKIGVVAGYVIKSDESWTTILTLGRSIRTVKTDDVVRREICRDPNSQGRASGMHTIFGTKMNSPNYPPCAPPKRQTPPAKKK
ncbi:hypothetical protein ACQP10_01170 [Streptosporangium sandarakinum]|uniref:hypothetical protein n=1 Tax=Streptosporangium sandarakinum TaxID=1260955 RepID=UPI003D921AB2